MTVTYDLYKRLDLDRSWDEKSLKERLKEIQKMWTLRQSACNDKEQLMIIEEILGAVEDGYRHLIKAIKRKLYDEALEAAYKKGLIQDDAEQQLKSFIEQAIAYYRKGNIKLAAKYAQEAIDGKVNDPGAYDLLARCYYDMQNYKKALDIIDSGVAVYTDNIDLHWLGARIAAFGTKNYEDAQRRVNTLIELTPDKPIGHSEQIYLHLCKGDEDLAFQEIDSYMASHTKNDDFRKGVAYDLDSHSNSCYYYDKAQNATFIADKEAYEKCLKLRAKAAEIFSDEYTQKQLEDAQYFGKKEWNSWNTESIKSLSIYGAIFLFLLLPLGLILLAIDAALIYYSFRPYWQINKTYVTGQMGTGEQIISTIGDYAARFGGWFLRFIFKAMFAFFRFILWLCMGGPFR